MKAIIEKQSRSVATLRIVLAALVALAIVALAAGSINTPVKMTPNENQIDASLENTLAARDDRKLDLRKPKVEPYRDSLRNYPDSYDSPKRKFQRMMPRDFDGLWLDQQLFDFVSRVA